MASRRFFDKNNRSEPVVPGGTQAEAVEYAAPRAMTAGVEQLDLAKTTDRKSRNAQAWQTAAWGYSDQIGEIKYAFGLTANITSRARFYAGVIDNNDEPPVDVEAFLDSVEGATTEQHATHLVDAAKVADEAIREFFRGGQARLTRILAINLQVTGERTSSTTTASGMSLASVRSSGAIRSDCTAPSMESVRDKPPASR
jgi:hypothetical protein